MNVRKDWLVAGCGLGLACGLFSFSAAGQEPRIDESPATESRPPLPLGRGARWLNYSLLAPLTKQPAKEVAEKRAPEQVAPEVKELTGVHERVGSVIKGSFLEKVGGPSDDAIKQRVWSEMTRQARAEAAATTQRVSDEVAESSSMPVFDPYQQAVDPTLAAIAQLRNSARNLDQAAADLEDAGKYAAADKLRSTAQRLRVEAREFNSAKETLTQEAAITR